MIHSSELIIDQCQSSVKMLRTLSIVVLFVAYAAAVCELYLEEPKPIVVKRFGSKTAIVKRTLTKIDMSTNETITFHCPTGISLNKNRRQELKLHVTTTELFCTDDGIYLDARKIVQPRTSAYISCLDGFGQALYESNSSLVGCNADAMTLLVGYRLPSMHDVKLLGMCYDLSEMRLRFVSFLSDAKRNLILEMRNEHELNDLHLDTYIGSLSKYFQFVNPSQFQQLISSQQQQQQRLGELFDAKLFEYASLLQDPQQSRELSAYADLLSIVWLRSLRSGNWKNFLSALRTARDNDNNNDFDSDYSFDVRLGVSGVASLPFTHISNSSRLLQITGSVEGSELLLPIPKYIWAHVRSLQSTGNLDDEFVVVAHNSPYSSVLELSSFCSDICDQIPWLSNTLFGQLHLVPHYGVMLCCRLDQLDKLTDFPLSRVSQPPPPLPPLPAITTTTPSTPLRLL